MDAICPLLVWALGRYVRLLVCIAQSTNLCYCERTNIVGTMAATIPTITLNNGRHMPAVGLGTWQYGGHYSYNHTEQWTPYARCWSGHLAGMYVYLFVSLNQLICVTVREQTLLALWRLLFLQSH
ncbi:hypothetical protein J6590_004998 [Homalodisca vitripennis]|nr:hypothetical protein J6590_004998 [Homalodisca vitripennis]